MSTNSAEDLRRIYAARFSANLEYRKSIWAVLIGDFFQRYVSASDAVLDLGCGYGEFINQVPCREKFAMDLNPDAPKWLAKDVKFFLQDCSAPWPLPPGSLDAVFTSNFFEHLPDKDALGRTLDQICQSLKPGGRLIALGPNIRFVPGAYWDFWDHYLPLTEKSLREALENRGLKIDLCVDRFLPYTMARGPRYPLLFLKMYLRLRPAWKILGKQFLVIGIK